MFKDKEQELRKLDNEKELNPYLIITFNWPNSFILDPSAQLYTLVMDRQMHLQLPIEYLALMLAWKWIWPDRKRQWRSWMEQLSKWLEEGISSGH